MKKNNSLFYCAILLLGSAVPSLSFCAQTPYIGKITGSKVNIRSKPDYTSDVIGRASKGDFITITQEAGQWIQVELPKNSYVWLHSVTVKDGKIKTAEANVRSAPSTTAAIVAQLPQDTRVEIIGQNAEWLKIKPPSECKGWIFSKYAREYSSVEGFHEKRKQEELSAKELEEARSFMDEHLRAEDITKIPYKEIIDRFNTIVFLFPGTDAAIACETIIKDLQEKEKMALQTSQYEEQQVKVEERFILFKKIQHFGKETIKYKGEGKDPEMRELLLAYNELKEKYLGSKELLLADKIMEQTAPFIPSKLIEEVKSAASSESSEEQRLFTFHGRVEELGIFIKRPGTHKLVKGRLFYKTVICYLRSDSIDLNSYVDKTVTITGSMEFHPGSERPVVNVISIQ